VSDTLLDAQFGLIPALVTYRGIAPALNNLVGSQIDYMINQSLNVIAQIKNATPSESMPLRLPYRRPRKQASTSSSEFGTGWRCPRACQRTHRKTVDYTWHSMILPPPNATSSRGAQAADRSPDASQKLVESELARITAVLKQARRP
jgi:hypothetical protein